MAKRNNSGRFLPGTSGNPNGRPLPVAFANCCKAPDEPHGANDMQNPVRKLAAQAASLDAACLSAAYEESEDVFASTLLETPKSRLAAIANGLANLKIDGGRNVVSAIGHMTAAQSIATDLLGRFGKCNERHLGRVVRRGDVMTLLADVREALPELCAAIAALDGCCSEMAEIFD